MKQAGRNRGTTRRFAALLSVAVLVVLSLGLAAQRGSSNRDEWQRPGEVMDALGLRAGSRVADIGAGRGYFTFHFAGRVGASGRVYAVDIQENRLEKICERAGRDNLPQIETILSKSNDPMIPAGSVDAILVMNAYHEFRDFDEMMQGMFKGLKSGGLLAIIDSPIERSGSRQTYHNKHDIPREVVKEDAARAGFRFLREPPGFTRPGRRGGTEFYFLLFEKPVN